MLNFQMKVGLLGEKLQIYTVNGLSKVQWENFQSSTKPLTWYQVIYYHYIPFVPQFFINLSKDWEGDEGVNYFTTTPSQHLYSILFNNLLPTFFH